MSSAIDTAKGAGILIFSAASNYGNFTPITFPGRLYRFGTLFCMFSTNAAARCLTDFNPTPEPNVNTASFAILGEDITISGKTVSGTSYSTAIGAALAGHILDFARHQDCRTRIRHRHYLTKVEGMAAVFSKMSERRQDNGYTFIVPWKLLPRHKNIERGVQREHICETISRALESIL